MTTVATTHVNANKICLAQRRLEETLAEACRRGFHGTVQVEVAIQDGVIQHVRIRTDKFER
jgi:hypothetical protein